MSIETPTLVTFIIYLVGMLAIGLIAYRMTNNLSDYVLGGRRLGPGVAALSAGASDMSSWLLLGLPGALYAAGMTEIWIAVGLGIGVYLNWQFVAKRLRMYTEIAGDSITLPDFFENRFKDNSKSLRVVSAILILVFFAFYTSAGLVGGAVLFENTFNLNFHQALWIGAIVIISYTFLGGFLAVSWTDFVQGILMFVALILVPIFAIREMGGWGETVNRVGNLDVAYLDAFTGASVLGIISLLAWGLGYFGQPHIITRFMAIKSKNEIPKAQLIGVSWVIFAMFGAVFTGFVGIAYFADTPLDNAETVFIQFTQVLFHPWIAGFLLAAILAAIMSTIDSQLLVSSSALTEDFYKAIFRRNATQKELVIVGRLGVLVIAIFALIMAYNPDATVMELVSYAWGGLGATFGPIIIMSLFWKRMTKLGGLLGMITGGATIFIWDALYSAGVIGFYIYEIVPAFFLSTLVIIVVSLIDKEPSQEIQDEFEKMKESL
ncbi:sodium/proline symporter PutP [Bacillus tamaricis]|uniref:Sodium/proline symporter n=2 Tax=Evansella tamaricis TaxID=2069301 RepID=A0ABS6J9L0_9BACI|nr:sodium/proline symporter PutP [Evansella tamaricis]MBU9710372.1 sodium/proline symporter PutP [Evansella tamaricis]